jgi:hypothetical protein
MARINYIHKLSSSASQNEGYELEVEVMSGDTYEEVIKLGKMAMDISRELRKH